MDGWISLHRKILEWEWYKDNNVKILFLHFLIKANFKDNLWQGIIIKRGSFLTGINVLSAEVNLSNQKIRTALAKLKKTNEIVIETTNRYSIITICNYEDYQSANIVEQQTDNKQITNKQQTNNKRITTTNKDNKDNKENKVNKENNINIDFEIFWNLYDYKKGKKDAVEKKWNSLKGIERKTIIEQVPKYVLSTPDKQFRKHPATYLNNESWNDEIVNRNGSAVDKYHAAKKYTINKDIQKDPNRMKW